MLMHNKLTLLGMAGLLVAALPAIAKPKATPKTASLETVAIENTGSTNTQGYAIVVSPTGTVQYHMGDDVLGQSFSEFTNPLPELQTKKLFHDLNVAMPLTSLPVHHGMRSASFGTSTYVTYKGQKSPDLTFATDPRTVALKADIDAVRKTFHIENGLKRPTVIMRRGYIRH